MISDLCTHSYHVCCDREVLPCPFIVFLSLHISTSIIQRETREPSKLQGNIAAITRNGPFVTMPIAWSLGKAMGITLMHVMY